MKKVVYNNDYGGFGISEACASWMADRGNKECIELIKQHRSRPVSETKYWYGSLRDTPRHDALLVMAVEQLGADIASGSNSLLGIHVLKGDRYYISEYDGSESVVEPKDVQWVHV